MKNKKIALIHDYLREYGGAERVLEALHEMFPEAPVYTAFVDERALGIHWQKFETWNIKTTWLVKIPLIKKVYSPLRFLAPKAFADLDLSKFDIVISSSNAYYAKAVKVPHGKHYCYCHTPPRSLYGYTTMSNWKKNPIIRIFGELINHYLRIVDFKIAQKVDVFIANSQETKRRIRKFYRRDSVVIYPPVETGRHPELACPPKWRVSGSQLVTKQGSRNKFGMTSASGYYLYVNRLALAKHPELAVKVCTKLNLPLKLVGTGKILPELQAMAGKSIEFLGSVDDETLHQLYSGAKALIYPVEDEDFGMIPVEAMGHGVPVIAHASGGPLETVIDSKYPNSKFQYPNNSKINNYNTGILFDELSVKGLEAAIERFEKTKFDREKIQKHAKRFSKSTFIKNITELLNS